MVTRQYLIDTGIILDYLSGRLPEAGMNFLDSVVDAIPNISAISKIELLSLQIPDQYRELVKELVQDSIVIELSDNIVKNSILINQTHAIELNHSIIAATAVTYNYTLISNITKPYAKIRGLSVVNPWEIFN
ncbi:MAG: type II toxin-antitoxin system VapC family toxin [Bacteroidia bacterium]|nr:type II toxin-antitoxin system VapC family toxin [Bacteroidia bacterium]MCC7532457.1 type II toxin-antitoxin system VapC family toxin [Bacteroidia bacterium]MCZ2140522.1 type II toxin-antitoxin system VapC family toxin [Bacteroidia bacterium]